MADKPVAATLRDADRAAKSEADVANSKDTALRTPGHETHRRPVTGRISDPNWRPNALTVSGYLLVPSVVS
jgi:hypothetical protein